MSKFAANLTLMFNELPFLDRFQAAADAGFKAVEFMAPYEFPAEEIAARLKACSLQNVLFTIAIGNWAAGERGIAALPGREAEFRDLMAIGYEYARVLGTPMLHVMAGIVPTDGDRDQCRATFIENLKYASAEAARRDLTLLVEPINTRDMPGYFLNMQAEAHAIREAVGADNLKVQMDLYHLQIMEGDIATKIRQYLPQVRHVQIAGVPGRHEPDTGEVNYPYLLALVDELGYSGWIGCEYRPANGTVEGLGWLRKLKARV